MIQGVIPRRRRISTCKFHQFSLQLVTSFHQGKESDKCRTLQRCLFYVPYQQLKHTL
jgi:hypothetical protein